MQITDLRGRLYKARKNRHGGDRKSSLKNSDMKEPKGRVTEQIAKELGVNRDTILNAGNFVDGLDAAESVVPGFKDDVLTGKQETASNWFHIQKSKKGCKVR